MEAIRNIEFGINDTSIAEELGKQGEHAATKLLIDCAEADAVWPGAKYTLSLLRYCDDSPYPALLGADLNADKKLEYSLTSEDTAAAGLIRLMLTVTQDNQVCKSCVFQSRISRSIEDGGDMLEARPDWVRALLDEVATMVTDAATNAAASAGALFTAEVDNAIKTKAEAAVDAKLETLKAEVTSATEAATQTADAAKSTADKANSDLFNLQKISDKLMAEIATGAYLQIQTGAQKLTNVPANNAANSMVQVNFPIKYKSTPRVYLTQNTLSPQLYSASVSGVTSSGFYLRVRNAAATVQSPNIFWMAVGQRDPSLTITGETINSSATDNVGGDPTEATATDA